MPTLFGKNSESEELEEKAASTGASPSALRPCRGPLKVKSTLVTAA